MFSKTGFIELFSALTSPCEKRSLSKTFGPLPTILATRPTSETSTLNLFFIIIHENCKSRIGSDRASLKENAIGIFSIHPSLVMFEHRPDLGQEVGGLELLDDAGVVADPH